MDTAPEKKNRQKRPARRKEPPLKIYCLPEERAAIEAHAKQSGRSISTFLRNVGMGSIPPSQVDQQSVRDLLKVNADLGRLGGVLKALLTHDERFDGYYGRQLQELTAGTVQDVKQAMSGIQNCAKYILAAKKDDRP